MQRFLSILWCACIVALSGTESSAQAPVAPKRYALLVAVAKYEADQLNQPPLKYPEADAKELRENLAKSGYQVDLLLGPEATRKAIMDKLRSLNEKGNSEGAVIVGFFGHGVEYSGTDEAMFCPYDSTMRLARDADGKILRGEDANTDVLEPDPKSLVGMSEILGGLKVCKAGNKLLLADCCRKSPNAARGRAFGSSVKLSDLPDKTACLFACSTGEEAMEHDDWKHGAMTKSFLDLLPELKHSTADVNAITGRMASSIESMVSSATQARKKQTLNPIVKGIVRLGLKDPIVSLFPRGQQLTESERRSRIEKASRELSKLSIPESDIDPSVAFIRGKIGGVKSLTFKLEKPEEVEIVRYMAELQSINRNLHNDIYESKSAELAAFLKKQQNNILSIDEAVFNWQKVFSEPRSSVAIATFEEGFFIGVPGSIRTLLAVTSQSQRLTELRKDFDESTDQAIRASLCGQYADALRLKKNFSHGYGVVIAPTLLGELDSATKLAESLEQFAAPAGHFFIIQTLLDEGRKDDALRLLPKVPPSQAIGVGAGGLPLPVFQFSHSVSMSSLMPQAYLAGRLDDEERFRIVDQTIRKDPNWSSYTKPYEIRLAYLVGLITDL